MTEKELLKKIVKHARKNCVNNLLEAEADILFVLIHQEHFKIDECFGELCHMFSMTDLLKESIAKKKLRKKLEKKLENYYITKLR